MRNEASLETLEGEVNTATAVGICSTIIVVAGLVAYANSFSVPLMFDDWHAIMTNPTIRSVRGSWSLLADTTRPVAYFSFAANYAVHGLNVWGYHAVNLAIHLFAALVLFDLVRRTLSREWLKIRYGTLSHGLGLAVALLWMAHPLQTESVTYVVQRMESLMGLFYLLTLYAFLRAQDTPRARWWYAASVGFCVLGIGTKEVMATAPLMIVWYDRVFVARSWKVVASRGRYYLALVATWAVPAVMLIAKRSQYVEGAALMVKGLSPWQYAISQPGAILHYLRLSLWPQGLCFDPGWPVASTAAEIVPPLVLIGALAVVIVVCMVRWPAWGFIGGWFFLVLAPTSSIVPIRDLAFEHRMYLSLASVAVLVVVGGYEAVEWALRALRTPASVRRVVESAVVLGLVAALGSATYARNKLYQNEVALWRDTVKKAPNHLRPRFNLARALLREGADSEAVACYREILQRHPNNTRARCRMAAIFFGRGELQAAETSYREALEVNPRSADAHCGLGRLAEKRGEHNEAKACYQKAIEFRPSHTDALFYLGTLLSKTQPDHAIKYYRMLLELEPFDADAHYNLGVLLARQGRRLEAIDHYVRALRWDPEHCETHVNLGRLLERIDPEAAMNHYRAALRIRPEFAEASNNLGSLLIRRGEYENAAACLRDALKERPDYANAHVNLACALVNSGRFQEALEHLHTALRLKPEYAQRLAEDPNFAVLWKMLDTPSGPSPSGSRPPAAQPDTPTTHPALRTAAMNQ